MPHSPLRAARRLARAARRWTRGAPFALALLLIAPRVGAAHTGLKRSDPKAGARLTASPTAIHLWFHERVQLAISRVRLVSPTGATALVVAADSADPTALVAALTAPLASGDYTIEWQTGGRDGHPVHGHFAFTVATPTAPVAATPPAATTTAPDTGRAGTPAASPAARTGAFNVALDSMMRDAADRGVAPTGAAPLGGETREAVSEHRVARWAEFMGLLAALGVLVFRFAVAPSATRAGHGLVARDATDGARQLGVGAIVLLIAAACARLYGETAALAAPGEPVTLASLRTVVSSTDWGHGWALGAVAAVLTLVGLLVAKRAAAGWALAALGGVGLAVTPALTGHSIATHDVSALAVTTDVLHVASAGAWLGTLLVVLLAALPAAGRRAPEERGPAAGAMVRAYHRVALTSVGLVLVSGLVSSWVRLRSLDALTMTSYGSLLLYKVFFFVFVGVVGLYNWKKVMPRLDNGDGARRLRRSATVELLVGAIVLAITAVLVATEPPDMANARAPRAAATDHATPQLP